MPNLATSTRRSAAPRSWTPRSRRRATPRPDQIAAVTAAVDCFKAGNARCQVIAACGTGKTLLGLWTAEALRARTVLVLEPSLALVRQTALVWQAHHDPDITLDVFCVCSDETVAEDISPSQLSGSGVPVTTSPDEIRRLLGQRVPRGHMRVIYATYQSAGKIAQAYALGVSAERPLRAPDLMLNDEAHILAGASGKASHVVLDDERIPATRRLFLTATPRVRLPRSGQGSPADVVSMDDVEIFGPAASVLSFGEAIRLGLLAEYRLEVLAVREADVDNALQAAGAADAVREHLTLAQAAATFKALSRGEFRHAFSFHHTRDAATQFVTALRTVARGVPGSRSFVFDSVSGATPMVDRESRIRTLLRAPGGVIASARALLVGVDVAEVDAVIFVDPKESVVDIAQGIGRALRRNPRRRDKIAHVVVPVVVPDALPDSDVAAVLSGSAWEPVWRILSAFASHDERLAGELALASRGLGTSDGGRSSLAPGDERQVIQPDGLLDQVLAVSLPAGVSSTDLRRQVHLRAVAEVGDPWEYGLGRLEAYLATHGSLSDLRAHTVEADDYPLGRWVSQQKSHARSGRLSAEFEARLSAIPGWEWERNDAAWTAEFARLQALVATRSTAICPRTLWHPASEWLGLWIQVQRSAYADGKLSARRARLLASCPGWSWNLSDGPALPPHTVLFGEAQLLGEFGQLGWMMRDCLSKAFRAHEVDWDRQPVWSTAYLVAAAICGSYTADEKVENLADTLLTHRASPAETPHAAAEMLSSILAQFASKHTQVRAEIDARLKRSSRLREILSVEDVHVAALRGLPIGQVYGRRSDGDAERRLEKVLQMVLDLEIGNLLRDFPSPPDDTRLPAWRFLAAIRHASGLGVPGEMRAGNAYGPEFPAWVLAACHVTRTLAIRAVGYGIHPLEAIASERTLRRRPFPALFTPGRHVSAISEAAPMRAATPSPSASPDTAVSDWLRTAPAEDWCRSGPRRLFGFRSSLERPLGGRDTMRIQRALWRLSAIGAAASRLPQADVRFLLPEGRYRQVDPSRIQIAAYHPLRLNGSRSHRARRLRALRPAEDNTCVPRSEGMQIVLHAPFLPHITRRHPNGGVQAPPTLVIPPAAGLYAARAATLLLPRSTRDVTILCAAPAHTRADAAGLRWYHAVWFGPEMELGTHARMPEREMTRILAATEAGARSPVPMSVFAGVIAVNADRTVVEMYVQQTVTPADPDAPFGFPNGLRAWTGGRMLLRAGSLVWAPPRADWQDTPRPLRPTPPSPARPLSPKATPSAAVTPLRTELPRGGRRASAGITTVASDATAASARPAPPHKRATRRISVPSTDDVVAAPTPASEVSVLGSGEAVTPAVVAVRMSDGTLYDPDEARARRDAWKARWRAQLAAERSEAAARRAARLTSGAEASRAS